MFEIAANVAVTSSDPTYCDLRLKLFKFAINLNRFSPTDSFILWNQFAISKCPMISRKCFRRINNLFVSFFLKKRWYINNSSVYSFLVRKTTHFNVIHSTIPYHMINFKETLTYCTFANNSRICGKLSRIAPLYY